MLGPVKVGVMEIVGTGVVGMAETGATGATGEVAVGISVSVATPGSSKVTVVRGRDMQNKGRPQQRGDVDTYV